MELNSFLEYELFEKALVSVMKTSGQYQKIEHNKIITTKVNQIRYEIDIVAIDKQNTEIFIECKTRISNIDHIIRQLLNEEIYSQKIKYVLATSSILSNNMKEKIQKHGIEVWDIWDIKRKFPTNSNDYFIKLFDKIELNSHAQDLRTRLLKCEPGKKDWLIYQKLVGEIFSALYSPPLEVLLYEHSDSGKINRRDYIIPNYSIDGFWYSLKLDYKADFLVIDAKNYSQKISKQSILQVANYLKEHGAGLFGMIFSRYGGNKNCSVVLKEQWILYRKMILIFDDNDLKNMLDEMSSGRNPEIIIKKKIQEFRLSL